MSEHTIIITVSNRVGVLAKITGLLSGRGYNIESIIAGPTENSDIYKIHLVIKGSDQKIEQVTKQLNKLIETIKVVDISHRKNYIVREFLMITVSTQKKRTELFELINLFEARVIDVTQTYITIDLSGPLLKIKRFIDILKPFGIKSFVRSGSIAISES